MGCKRVNQAAKNANWETDRLQIYATNWFHEFFGSNYFTIEIELLFFMVSDIDPFSAKPVLDLIVAAYDHEAIIAVLVY